MRDGEGPNRPLSSNIAESGPGASLGPWLQSLRAESLLGARQIYV